MKIKHLSLAALCAFFAACSDSNSTSTDQHEHFEAEGWNLYWPDWKLRQEPRNAPCQCKLP